MTLYKAREYLKVQVMMGGGYNRNSAKLILTEIQKDHGQAGVDQFIKEFNLEDLFGFKVGEKIII